MLTGSWLYTPLKSHRGTHSATLDTYTRFWFIIAVHKSNGSYVPSPHAHRSSHTAPVCAGAPLTQERTDAASAGSGIQVALPAPSWALSGVARSACCTATMSLLTALPAPSKQHAAPVVVAPASSLALAPLVKEAPPYLRRQGFVPRKADDFGDGGAFPEIHIAQYPLDMGKGGKGEQQLAVTVSADGRINYDSIIKQGGNRDRVVHSDHSALVPKLDLLNKEVSDISCRNCTTALGTGAER